VCPCPCGANQHLKICLGVDFLVGHHLGETFIQSSRVIRTQNLQYLSRGLTGVCLLLGLGRALTAQPPSSPLQVSSEERTGLGLRYAAEEPRRRQDSVQHFPGDRWSQDDDFHASERGSILESTQTTHHAPLDYYRAIDEELRASPVLPPRKATASPCKPRPFYD